MPTTSERPRSVLTPGGTNLLILVPRIDRAFKGGLVAFAAVAATLTISHLTSQQTRDRIVRGVDVVRLSSDARGLATDRETTVRSLLPARDSLPLAIELAARDRIVARLDSLRMATAASPVSSELVARARVAHAAWDSAYIHPVLEALRTGAPLSQSSVEGNRLFDAFRGPIERLIVTEQQSLADNLRRQRIISVVSYGSLITELALLVGVLIVLRKWALAQAKHLSQQQAVLERQAVELEARANAFEREASRSNSLAEYLRTTNQELQRSIDALSEARAETATAVRDREESASTLDVLLASAPFGIALLDREFRFDRVNDALTRLDGVPASDHAGKQFRDVLPALAASIEPVLRQVLATEQPILGVEMEGEAGVGTGRLRHWLLNAYPVRSIDGAVRGLGTIFVETTDRKNLERQLLHAQKMEAVGRLAGSIAHDFNNLLTAISAFAQFASEGVTADHPSHGDIGQILLATERGSALTRRLLAFSRQQVLQPRALDLNRVISSLEGLLQRLLGEDVKLVTHLEPNIWPVDVDPGQMEQVILNLAVNARDAMPRGGTLHISTENVELDAEYVRGHADARAGSFLMLAVSDTGTGMDASTQAHIFEPFFTTKPMGKGTGLGLSTVYGIVKQSGGTIWLYSERDRGTTFKVYLPRGQHAVEAAPKPREAASRPKLGPVSILLVEDDSAVRLAVHRVLTQFGCTVHDTENGHQATVALEQMGGGIDLILTDLVMPEMGGVEFAKVVKERWPRMRILFMSGYTAESMQRQTLLDAGAWFIEKPFTSDALISKVREVLEPGQSAGGVVAA